MLAPQSAWDAVEKSHKALSEGILAALQSISLVCAQHVLTLPPSQREQASAAIHKDQTRLSECRERIHAAQKTLEDLNYLCSSTQNMLQNRIQPIGALPIETIQHIISFTLESPTHRKQICQLSRLSRTWRSAVLGMPKLFVSPDWEWPRGILETWISRAGSRSLNVYIPQPAKDTVDDPIRAIVPQLASPGPTSSTCRN
ncbi:hypothetical protein DL93DRAFT_2229831, partial [Clavulina sp. PMI_390]